MLREPDPSNAFDGLAGSSAGTACATAPKVPRWTVVIPYYNEAEYLGATLESLAAQVGARFRLVLVDNGSTDGTAHAVAAWAAAHRDIDVLHIAELQPGQVHALKAGIDRVTTELVAICDADTVYPPHYLATAAGLFDARGGATVAVLAHDAPAGGSARPRARLRRLVNTHFVSFWLRGQAHAGGYAHCYRTAALHAAGGYDAKLWPYVIKDHELVHRVLRHGRLAYAVDHWCSPSPRRADRRGVRWTLPERILYHATPYVLKDWFFYDFLRPRLIARNQIDTVLRQRNWLQVAAE
jgi:glycosyltransferase involved in cell wall biosynthesis